jgi:hypothetical protein
VAPLASIGLATPPDLGTWRSFGAPIELLIAAQTAGTWSVTSGCSTAPVFQTLDTSEIPVGWDASLNYNVYGDQKGIRIWTDDPIPPGLEWDEASGRVTGRPTATGTWNLTVNAEDVDGNGGSTQSAIIVYEVVDLGCEQSIATPGGVFHTALASQVSALTITLDAGDEGGTLAFAAPATVDPGSADGDGASADLAGEIALALDPTTWPRVQDYLHQGPSVYTSVTGSGTVTARCDLGPRPAFADLPVVDTDLVHVLEAIGGTPPYAWSATGLPDGVTLSPAGALAAQSPSAGRFEVVLTLEDAAGATWTGAYDLSIGAPAACGDVLACGDSATISSDGGDRYLCHVHRPSDGPLLWMDVENTGEASVQVYALDPGAVPGATDLDAWTEQSLWMTYLAAGEHGVAAVDEGGSPPLSAWFDRPMWIGVSRTDEDPWEVEVALDCR